MTPASLIHLLRLFRTHHLVVKGPKSHPSSSPVEGRGEGGRNDADALKNADRGKRDTGWWAEFLFSKVDFGSRGYEPALLEPTKPPTPFPRPFTSAHPAARLLEHPMAAAGDLSIDSLLQELEDAEAKDNQVAVVCRESSWSLFSLMIASVQTNTLGVPS